MDPNRKRLEERINARAEQLRMPWREVARRAGMSTQNLLRLRQGDIAITDKAAYGVDHALFWVKGSVFAVLAGGEPTPLDPDVPVSSAPVDREGVPSVAFWTTRQIAEKVIELDREAGEKVARAFLVEAVQLQTERAERQTETGEDSA